MSESHDIEQIARDMASAVYGPTWEDLGESLKEAFRGVAHAVILPLLASAREEGARIPERWKLVPVEDTPEMRSAFLKVFWPNFGPFDEADFRGGYANMLAHAPLPSIKEG